MFATVGVTSSGDAEKVAKVCILCEAREVQRTGEKVQSEERLLRRPILRRISRA